MVMGTRPLKSHRRARRGRAAGRLTTTTLATLFMIAFGVYFLLPLVWLMFSATKTNTDLSSSYGLWFAPTFALGANAHDVFTRDDGLFAQWFVNTVLYAGTVAIVSTFLAMLIGYALAKYRFRGREVIFAAILGSIMVPGTALVLPLFLLLSKAHLVNTYWGVILPQLVNPFGVYLMRVYSSQAVPDDLLAAARVDGAGELRAFWSIAARLLTPGFVTVFLFGFVGTWNNYFLPLVVLSDPKLYPLTLGLASWQTKIGLGGEMTYTVIITGALIALIPLVVAFLLLQRYWRSGLLLGSMTG